MKRVIILLVLITSFSYAIGFAVGKEFISGGTLTIKNSPATTIDVLDSMGLYIEAYQGNLDISGIPAAAGVGIKFNSYTIDGSEEGVGTVATVYGIGRFEWDLSAFKPYAQLRIGYPYVSEGQYLIDYNDPGNTHFNDLVGIYYLSLGIGATISFVDVSVNYDYNNYKFKSGGFGDMDATSGNIGINLGAKF